MRHIKCLCVTLKYDNPQCHTHCRAYRNLNIVTEQVVEKRCLCQC